MWSATVEPASDVAAWREVARHALCAGIAPESIEWNGGDAGLLAMRDVRDAEPDCEPPAVAVASEV